MDKFELRKYPRKKELLLEILHDIQNQNPQHYISIDSIKAVAKHLNVTQSQVCGVVGYYSMFSTTPRGKYIIRVCNSPICNMLGSVSLIDYLKQKLNVENSQTTSDGLFTLESCECLGRCGKAPSMMINDSFYGNLNVDLLNEILNSFK